MLTLLAAALSEAPRYWPKFSGARAVVTLDGEWAFGVLDRPSAFDSMSRSFSPADAPTPNKTSVPSCFDAAGMGQLGVRGVGFYRTTFEHAGAARLQFQACSFYCRVFVDGKEIGEHAAGRTPTPPPPTARTESHLNPNSQTAKPQPSADRKQASTRRAATWPSRSTYPRRPRPRPAPSASSSSSPTTASTGRPRPCTPVATSGTLAGSCAR